MRYAPVVILLLITLVFKFKKIIHFYHDYYEERVFKVFIIYFFAIILSLPLMLSFVFTGEDFTNTLLTAIFIVCIYYTAFEICVDIIDKKKGNKGFFEEYETTDSIVNKNKK